MFDYESRGRAAWVHLLRMPVARNIGFLISEVG